jgi:uncharacterized protein with HEPN domain
LHKTVLMPSERIRQCFTDIVAAVELIKRWVAQAGGIERALSHDVLIRSAIERQFLIISEAAIRLHKLDPSAQELAPQIDWSGVRGIGNFIRHKYDDLEAGIIADVLKNRLDELRAAAAAVLSH